MLNRIYFNLCCCPFQDQVVLWEHELYHEIDYQQPLPFFHTFETDDRQAGLNFASENEAHHFFVMVQEKISLLHRRREGEAARVNTERPNQTGPENKCLTFLTFTIDI